MLCNAYPLYRFVFDTVVTPLRRQVRDLTSNSGLPAETSSYSPLTMWTCDSMYVLGIDLIICKP